MTKRCQKNVHTANNVRKISNYKLRVSQVIFTSQRVVYGACWALSNFCLKFPIAVFFLYFLHSVLDDMLRSTVAYTDSEKKYCGPNILTIKSMDSLNNNYSPIISSSSPTITLRVLVTLLARNDPISESLREQVLIYSRVSLNLSST